jgi:hypothetical protein
MDGEGPSSAPSSTRDPAAARRAHVAAGAFVVLFGLGIGGIVLWSWHDERSRMARDPHVRGRVVSLAEAEHQDDESSGWRMDLTLEITTVDGRVVVLRRCESMSGRDALQILSQQEVDVWYRRDDPQDALVRWGPRGGSP